MKETKIVELVIEDDSEALAIDAISLVNAPAIETDFVFFGKEKNNLTFAKVDEEKRMIISPALIPNKQIFRYDPNTDQDYYVYFSPKTVRQASELYLKHNNHHKATEEHKERVAGVLTVESWIIQDSKMDKSALYGFSLPKGTWMVSMKIENDELWSKIKSGELKGLSIEGYFIDKIQKMKKQDFTTEEVRTALKELLSVQKVELALVDDLVKDYESIKSKSDALTMKARKAAQDLDEVSTKSKSMLKEIADAQKIADEIVKAAKDLGVGLPNEAIVAARQIDAYRSDMSEVSSTTGKASDLIFGLL
tara:strand:+ start:768 stop:1688 length:921 start_codon:yes stop_codon:yes gene_type:complete